MDVSHNNTLKTHQQTFKMQVKCTNKETKDILRKFIPNDEFKKLMPEITEIKTDSGEDIFARVYQSKDSSSSLRLHFEGEGMDEYAEFKMADGESQSATEKFMEILYAAKASIDKKLNLYLKHIRS